MLAAAAAAVLAAAAAAAGAPPPRAPVAVFRAGPDGPDVFSADGYHAARCETVDGEDRWRVDEAVRVRGAEGTLCGPAVLSRNGAVLMHLIASGAGAAAAVNGRAAGPAYREIAMLRLSPDGRNAAYAAKGPSGWTAVTADGPGPSFPQPPLLLQVSDRAWAYAQRFGGTVWLYRSGVRAPIRTDLASVSLSPDLRRAGGVVRPPGARDVYVEVDGARWGPYENATDPAFSANGAHWASLVAPRGAGRFTGILADGREAPAAACRSCSLLVGDDGRAVEDVLLMAVNARLQMHRGFLDGEPLGSGARPVRFAWLAGGGRFVYPFLGGKGLGVGLDRTVLGYGVPMAVRDAPVAFDGPREYHYWALDGARLSLVCGTTDGSDPMKTRCAAFARGVYGDPLP
jgi:hypothetical protein